MIILTYHSTLLTPVDGLVVTTSSDIFLSGGVAPPSRLASPFLAGANLGNGVSTVFESPERHIMTLSPSNNIVANGPYDGDGKAIEGAVKDSGKFPGHDCKDNASDTAATSSSILSAPCQSASYSIISRNMDLSLDTDEEFDNHDYREKISTDVSVAAQRDNTDTRTSTNSMAISKDKNMDRGRLLQRHPRLSSSMARSDSRFEKNYAFWLDAESTEQRRNPHCSLFDRPPENCAILEDNLLEPCPDGDICGSVDEIIDLEPRVFQTATKTLGSSSQMTSINSKQDMKRTFQRETLQTTPLAKSPHYEYIAHCFTSVVPATRPETSMVSNQTTDNNLRSACSVPFVSRDHENVPTRFDVSCLPTEIIEQIYFYLAPVDFNAARHACRSWFLMSLEYSLLETMLKRGGWYSSARKELVSNHVSDSQGKINDEWLMSKHVARECALGPDWTGNGLGKHPTEVTDLEGPMNSESPMVHVSTTDLTSLGADTIGTKVLNVSATISVSTCGKFLMVSHGCLVWIYELNKSHQAGEKGARKVGSLKPFTSISTPRQVHACSMDTSSGRYSIAILMDGRMGIVCSLLKRKKISPYSWEETSGCDEANINEGHRGTNRPQRLQQAHSKLRPEHLCATSSAFTMECHEDGTWQDILPNAFQPDSPLVRKRHDPVRDTYAIQFEQSPPSFYRHLCSIDDPPRSVAICPQRRCVAFGCGSGIELHWVDALTGQDLNRYFPLVSPSDYLYFLPPRPGVDGVKKLRLISSAGHPELRNNVAEQLRSIGQAAILSQNILSGKEGKFGEGSLGCANGGETWGLFIKGRGSWSGHETEPGHNKRSPRDTSDHYRAVPLSDGYHILFIDPATGLLCLGSDAPIGGPTKLLRKIWFCGPKQSHEHESPVVYCAGRNLDWGVRVVAAYDKPGSMGSKQDIYLFSVPADVFLENIERNPLINIHSLPSYKTQIPSREWRIWWSSGDGTGVSIPDGGMNLLEQKARERRTWPVKVRGQYIGSGNEVVELSIDSGKDMGIWAVGRDGIAKAWQLKRGDWNGSVSKYIVVSDGTTRAEDLDRDLEMVDVSTTNLSPPTLDGAASELSSPGRRSVANNDSFNDIDGILDANSDVMRDLVVDAPSKFCELDRRSYGSQVITPKLGLRYQEGKVEYRHQKYQGRSYIELLEEDGQDLVEQLAEIARIELEML